MRAYGRSKQVHVLVIGSSGFLGSFVVEALLAEGHEVTGADLTASPWAPDLPWVKCDVRDVATLRSTFAEYRPEAVMNLSGVLGTQETFDHPQDTVATNVLGSINVLDCARDWGMPYIGVQTGTPWFSPYAISKRSATEFVRSYHFAYGLRGTVLKVFNAYGPRQDGTGKVNKIIPRFVHNALRGEPIPIFGSGEQVIDLVHAEDCAAAFSRALTRAPFKGEVIEVGSGKPIRVLDVAQAVIDIVGQGSVEHGPRRMGEGAEYPVADLTVCRDVLGFVPDASLDRLAATVEWYRRYFDTRSAIRAA
jgi:UDP-glucose 4-epimerase